MGLTHARTECVTEEVLPCFKANGPRIYHSSAHNVEFKNAWDYMCIPPYVLGVIINL